MDNEVLIKLQDHLAIVPFDTDRKYFRMAIREIEIRNEEINRLKSIIESYKSSYPYNDYMLKRINDV